MFLSIQLDDQRICVSLLFQYVTNVIIMNNKVWPIYSLLIFIKLVGID